MSFRKTFPLVFLCLLLLITAVSVYQHFYPPTSPPIVTSNPEIHLIIDGSAYDMPATQSATALDLLLSASNRFNFPVTYKKFSFGTLVESINNQSNSPDLAWIYFINGQSANVGVDQYRIQPGDTIEWKYVKPQF